MDLFNINTVCKLKKRVCELLEKQSRLNTRLNVMEDTMSMMDDELKQVAIKEYLGKTVSIENPYGATPIQAVVDDISVNRGLVALYEQDKELVKYPLSHLKLLVTILPTIS